MKEREQSGTEQKGELAKKKWGITLTKWSGGYNGWDASRTVCEMGMYVLSEWRKIKVSGVWQIVAVKL